MQYGTKVHQTNFDGCSKAFTAIPATSLVVKASPGTLYSLTINNTVNFIRFIFLLNATSLPVNGDVSAQMLYPPIMVSQFSTAVFEPAVPIVATTGIVVASSTTGTGAGPTWSLTLDGATYGFLALYQ